MTNMTLQEFMELAVDGTEFVIYDIAQEKRIYDSASEDGLYDEISEMEVLSWEIDNGQIVFCIDTDAQ